MVIDTLDNLKNYECTCPLFKDVVAFLKENDLNSLPEGKTFIKGNGGVGFDHQLVAVCRGLPDVGLGIEVVPGA